MFGQKPLSLANFVASALALASLDFTYQAATKAPVKEYSYVGKIVSCQFGRYGKVVLNTRYPGTMIIIAGKVYQAWEGNRFYRTNNHGGQIVIRYDATYSKNHDETFTKLNFTDFETATPHERLWGIDGKHCVVRANQPNANLGT